MKKIISVCFLTMVMALSIVIISPIKSEAASAAEAQYEFLFPVNNGGSIAFLYGKTSEYFGGNTFHDGIDIYANGDQLIYAAFSGTVVGIHNSCGHVHYPYYNNYAKCDHYSTWGNSVYVVSDDGNLRAIYGHLKQNSILVKNGDKVEQGQPLASMGSSGYSTDKHLHFEVRKNGTSTKINVNPPDAKKNPGVVDYITVGYNQPKSDSVPVGTHTFYNDGYGIYMKKDESNYNTLGASNAAQTSKFEFNISKDGNFYRVVPKDGGKNYLNSVWNDKKTTHSLDGAEVTLCKNDTKDYSQKWLFEKYGDGYVIHPACTPAFAITRDGNKIVVKKTTYASNQIWLLDGGECDHKYEYKFVDDRNHKRECKKCGEANEERHTTDMQIHYNDTHSYVYCTVCKTNFEYSEHIFDNACDSSCNTCRYTRTTTHTYSNPCDTSCNVCDARRVTSHEYDNGCDTSCNLCGETRVTNHRYLNACDKTCDVCGAVRSVPDHLFDHGCDTSCNNCGYSRPTDHTYDNGCDESCNVCGATRVVAHLFGSTYVNDEDSHWRQCVECGYNGYIENHIPGTPATEKYPQRCIVCEFVIQPPLGHTTHNYSTEYKKDSNQHWYECECGVKKDIEVHKYDNDCDSSCNTCGYVRSVIHVFANNCDTDCNTCGYVREAEHAFDNGTVTKEPTETEKGKKTYVCLECGAEKYEDVDALSGGSDDDEEILDKLLGKTIDLKTVIIISVAVAFVAIVFTAMVMRKKSYKSKANNKDNES